MPFLLSWIFLVEKYEVHFRQNICSLYSLTFDLEDFVGFIFLTYATFPFKYADFVHLLTLHSIQGLFIIIFY